MVNRISRNMAMDAIREYRAYFASVEDVPDPGSHRLYGILQRLFRLSRTTKMEKLEEWMSHIEKPKPRKRTTYPTESSRTLQNIADEQEPPTILDDYEERALAGTTNTELQALLDKLRPTG